MTIDRTEMLRVAGLAELGVRDEDIERLTRDIDHIVDYVSRLGELDTHGVVEAFLPGPVRTPLRDDVVAPIPLAHGPEALAPEFVDGFFVVPKLSAMESE